MRRNYNQSKRDRAIRKQADKEQGMYREGERSKTVIHIGRKREREKENVCQSRRVRQMEQMAC